MDGSEMARRALEFALGAHPDAEVTALTVVGEPSTMMGEAAGLALADDVERAARERARNVQDRAREIAAEYGTEVDTDVQLGHPVRAILDRAGEYDAIVMGSHGGTLSERLFVGNVAEKVLRRSPVPVTVVR
jgi:nucleotide-binding universal stress UspA family protein